MGAHFDHQTQQKTFRKPNMVTAGRSARQFGSGGLGAFATRKGRVAIPLVKQYVKTVAKQLGKNLINICARKY